MSGTTKRQILAAVLTVGVVGAVLPSAAAAQEAIDYSGCITLTHRLVKVAEGDAPERPCNTRETEIHWTVEAAALEPSVVDDLLPGISFVTEEVDPGVFRVINDGVRSTAGGNSDVVSGADGSVWLFRDWQFFRLGDSATHEWRNPLSDIGQDSSEDIEVGPDGTVWWADPDGEGLKSFDGEEWTVRRAKPGANGAAVDQVEVRNDGTVLASWRPGASRRQLRVIAELGDGGWERLARVPGASSSSLGAGGVDDLWLLPESFSGARTLHRGSYPRGAVGGIEPFEAPSGETVTSDVGSDGTVWLHLWREPDDCDKGDCGQPFGHNILARFDETGWTEFSLPDGLVDLGGIAAAPDGSLWSATCGWADGSGYADGCEWLRFDGVTWSRMLGSLGLGDIDEIAFAPDGVVWTIVGPNDLYAIRPEAYLHAE